MPKPLRPHEDSALAAGKFEPEFEHIVPLDYRDPQEWGRKKREYETRMLQFSEKFRKGLSSRSHLLRWNFSPGFDPDEHLKLLEPIMVGPVVKIQTKMARLRAWIYKVQGRDGRIQYRTFLNANYPEPRANWLRRSRAYLYQNEVPEMICLLLRACQWIADDLNQPMPEALLHLASVGFVFDRPSGESTITTSYDDARRIYQDQQERYDFEKGKLVKQITKRGHEVPIEKSPDDPPQTED